MNKLRYVSHNWLAHKINNKAVADFRHLFRGRIIDLGCGTAQYKEDIQETAREYIGVDWKSSYHDQTNVDVFADLCERLPFSDGNADTIVSFQVMEHLPEPEIFIGECFRILKSGGTLLLTIPFMWHVHEAPFDYFRYTRHGIQYLLEKQKFTDITIVETSGFWQMIVLKFNYHSLRFARGPLRCFWVPFWWLGQNVAPVLDRFDPHPEETASYVVIAKKPDVA